MPSTVYNIDRIIERVPDQSRATILDVMDEIQTIIYSQDCLQTQKIESTGYPPYIVTTDGIYEYNCPSDCRRTAAVFTLNPRRRSRIRPIGPRREYYFRDRGYYKVNVRTKDANIDDLAVLWFDDDPGDTTETYYHLYYIKPTPLEDETINLTLPEEVHWLVRKAVIAMFTTEEYGDSAFDDNTIERVARKIRNSLNRGAQGVIGHTPVREELMDDSARHYGYRI